MAVASAAAVAAAALAFATPSHRGSAVVRRTGMPGRVCPALTVWCFRPVGNEVSL